MLPGDDAVVTGPSLMLSPENMDIIHYLEHGELVQILEINESTKAALVWGASSGAQQWISLDALTPLGVMFGGFKEGFYDD